MAKSLMIQGTASDAGKSLIAAGLCRILKQDGYTVVPFKSQNMALNSFITKKGFEMGRAQVVQAEAAGIDPDVRMNPVLLKPTSDRKSQVVFMGKVLKDMDAVDYHEFKQELLPKIKEVYQELDQEYDAIILEGAGSPAEINLNERDIVNMGMARLVDAPVILVADIDKGGVFASIYGTIELMPEEDRKRIKGVLINKFRGDVALLQSGIDMIEELTQVPVLGVVPYADIDIDSEDSVALGNKGRTFNQEKDLDVAIITLKRISNFTDFHSLEIQPDVSVRYVMPGDEIHMGETEISDSLTPFSRIILQNGEETSRYDGAVSPDKRIQGTYLHGVFDNSQWTRDYLNQIRIEKGLEPVTDQVMDLKEFKDLQYDKLAAVIRDSVDMKKIYQIMNGEEL